MEIKQSVCNYCSTGCNLSFTVEDNKIVKILGQKDYPVNNGTACIKGLNLDKQCTVYGKQRLPLLRGEDGKMHEISWEEAFKVFVKKMGEIQEKHGKESAAFISTGQLPMEEMALLGLVGRGFMGMHGDGNTRLCMATSAVAYKQSFGFDAPPYTLHDIDLTDTLILIGANPAIAHPVTWGRIRKNKDAKLIVIDPRKSETAAFADEWYGILELAETINNGKRVSFWWTMGVNQGYEAVRTAQAIINIAVMTGNIGREGTGPNSITGQSDAMGSRLYSNTTCLYAGRDYANEEDRKLVREVMGIEDSDIPKKPTLAYPEIIEGAIKGDIKALWIVSTNPVDSWVDNKTFMEARKNLDFLVVQDLYADTDTAKICDLFLPAVPGIKKTGAYINTERRVSRMIPLVEKEENELTDFEILKGIGKALGREKALEKWNTTKDAFELLKKCSEGMPCDITGIDYDKLVGSKGIQWPFRKGEELKSDTRRLFEDNKFYTPNGKMKFMYEDVRENSELPSKEYPYIFNTGRGTVGQWHTQTRTREIPIVNKTTPKDPYIELSKELAEELNIVNGDKIIVKSSNGESVEVDAKINEGLPYNQLYGPMHYIETNRLTKGKFDTYSREPSYKYVTVNVFKK